jgi:glycosyltransferase involved in cell wall biosynthesis
MAGIDVAVPCYQYGRYLRECVSSVLTQPVDGIRVLIIDNASTDDSVEVAQQLAAEDSRVEVVVHAKNMGATASYNEAIEWAAAEYFCLLDADDLLAPGALARATKIMNAHPELSFTGGFEAHLFPDGRMTTPTRLRDAQWEVLSGQQFVERYCNFPRNGVGAPSVLRRTAAQKRAGFYRPELTYSDDVEMWLRLAAFGGVGLTDDMQGIRRIHPAQMSEGYRRSMIRDFRGREAALESFFANEGRSIRNGRALLAKAKRRLGQHAYWSSISHVCRGHVREGMTLFGYCLSREPISVVVPPVGWLLQMDRPFQRAVDIGSDALKKGKPPVRRALP